MGGRFCGTLVAVALALVCGCSPSVWIGVGVGVALSGGGGGGGGGGGVDLRITHQAKIPGRTALAGDVNVAVIQIRLEALKTDVDVSSITFHADGTGDDSLSGLSVVNLYEDLTPFNGDWDATDILLQGPRQYSSDDGDVTFTFGSPVRILASTPQYWILVYDLGAAAGPPDYFCANLWDGDDVTAALASGGSARVSTSGSFSECVDIAFNPRIESVAPNQGPQAGGTTVAIVTQDFQDDFTTDPPNRVQFGGVDATNVMGTAPNTLSVTTPAVVSPGVVDVFVDAVSGDQATLAGGFEYLPLNSDPVIGTPSGPGTVGGSDPTYATTVNIGDSLSFDITATDLNTTDSLTFTATVTGGSLNATQAGFTTSFPSSVNGTSPQTLSFLGTAANPGDITITFDVDDGQGATDVVTLDIAIDSVPLIGTPSGPGSVGGSDPSFTTTVNIGDSLDFSVTATDADAADSLTFTATVTGGSLTAAQAGFTSTFPSTVTGVSPQTLGLTGMAANTGDITLTIDVDDGRGGVDLVTLAITINAGNASPIVGAPSGPGSVGGSDPSYTSLVNLGSSLGFTVTATDADATDTLTFTATVTGGSLNAAQAGFTTSFPNSVNGTSPQVLTFAGTSANPGDIVLSISVDDGQGGMDIVTHTIRINSFPQVGTPSGPGTVGGVDPSFTSTVNVGSPLDFTVTATDADATDNLTFTATATGGSLTPVQAGFSTAFPNSASGVSPQVLGFAGTAASPGDIVITFDVDDGGGGTDVVTLTLRINAIPQVQTPTGPGTLGGSDPAFTSLLNVGDSLDFTVQATDADAADNLTFTTDATAGSLTPAQAGFTTTFPNVANGTSPQTMSIAGTAANPGDILLTIDVDDGQGGFDVITLAITINAVPQIGAPTGPGTVTGADPNYASILNVGDSLGFGMLATDADPTDNLTFTANYVGGSLTPFQAGFLTPFPNSTSGPSPQGLNFAGLAASPGDITISFDVDDGRGGVHSISLAIRINAVPQIGVPTGPGIVSGAYPSYTSMVHLGDPLNFTVTATDADPGDTLAFTANVTGGTLTAAQAGFSTLFPAVVSGPSPVVLSIAGVAANPGDIVLTIDVDDGVGGTDVITHKITIVRGSWTPVPGPMNQARYGHTATLLPNGMIMIVGGLHDAASPANPGFREALSTIEMFDPSSNFFGLVFWDRLVHPRAYQKAIRTPGPDDIMGTPDDYVVIVGGWNSERTDSAGGPRSEGTIEVIVPDWNGDGLTDDLVVNPTIFGMPSGLEVTDIGTRSLPLSPFCSDVVVPVGLQDFDIQWAPGLGWLGPANNELLMLGGFNSYHWDACNMDLTPWMIFDTALPPSCEDYRTIIAIDPDGNRDLTDSMVATISMPGAPWTGPVSLFRIANTQTRVAGPDGLDGTFDDAQFLYGGGGFDRTADCQGGNPPICGLGDLEYWDLGLGPIYTGIDRTYDPPASICGMDCLAPGVGVADRNSHVAVATGNSSQSILILGGMMSNAGPMPCPQAIRMIRPNFVDPTTSNVMYGGLDAIPRRTFGPTGSGFPGTGNVLLAGGIDRDAGGSTASAIYVQSSTGQVEPAAEMTKPRDYHAAVTLPAGFLGPGNPPEDTVFVFAGITRSDTTYAPVRITDPGTANDTAEFYLEK